MAFQTFRDRWGIPHLRADTVDELAYAQGRNAALDRAWQIELERWRSEGRTAEYLGATGLDWDQFARRARLDDTARRCFTALDRRTQEWCAAYVNGVNAALPAGAVAAAEFELLDCAPGEWSPWSPVGVFIAQHIMFSTFPDKLWRGHAARQFGDDALDYFRAEGPTSAGSNAWAVTGQRTASGFPLIAGDPHRYLDLPGVYQQVRLACPDFDVLGLAFPGVPGIQHFGHAGGVAWAITNAMADYQDLYREELRRDGDAVWARGPAGWTTTTHHHEQIVVRGAAIERVEVIVTDRGPVIMGGPGEASISLRTPTGVEGEIGFNALLPLLHANSVDDVAQALASWVEPVNSVLVADRAGTVRHLLAGRVPLRHPTNRIQPVPAWAVTHQWAGYATMPAEPVTDLTANGNDRVSGSSLGYTYAAPHRADRIRSLLADRTRLAPDDMPAVHTDSRLGSVDTMRRLVAAVEVDGPAAAVRDVLLAWDGRMEADSSAAGTFAAWRAALVRWLADHPALAGLEAPANTLPHFARALSLPNRVSLGWERLVQHAHRLDIAIGDGSVAALEAVAPDGDGAPWGDRHRLAPLHGLGTVPGLVAPTVAAVGLSGETDCVLAMSSVPGLSDLCSRGPVARYVWDLADRSNSQWVVPFGASGRFGDTHFDDQLPLWATGQLIPIVTDWNQLTSESAR